MAQRTQRARAVLAILTLLSVLPFAGCSDDSLKAAADKLAASQRAAVNAKMAADEAAINPQSIGKMLQMGFSIPAILSTITQQHGIGDCCQAAFAIGSARGASALQSILREDPGEYSSDNGGVEGTVKLLASRAGTCCRGTLWYESYRFFRHAEPL